MDKKVFFMAVYFNVHAEEKKLIHMFNIYERSCWKMPEVVWRRAAYLPSAKKETLVIRIYLINVEGGECCRVHNAEQILSSKDMRMKIHCRPKVDSF